MQSRAASRALRPAWILMACLPLACDGEEPPGASTCVPSASGSCQLVDLAAGATHTCAVVRAGTASGAWCWGANEHGQLGDGTTTGQPRPVRVRGLVRASRIVAGDGFTCVLDDDTAPDAGGSPAHVLCWGRNDHGQLGDGTTTERHAPVTVAGLGGPSWLSAGTGHACALDVAGALRCWGANGSGQLGDGSTTDRSAPVAAGFMGPVRAVSAGGATTCVLSQPGSVACWGEYHASPANPLQATQLPSMNPLSAVGAGPLGVCAVVGAPSGTVMCWQTSLGDGRYVLRHDPTGGSSTSLGVIQQVVGGRTVRCAAMERSANEYSGTVWCWGGHHEQGQLGTGEAVTTPIGSTRENAASRVRDVHDVLQVVVGDAHGCVRDTNNSVWCWGANDQGQLGDATRTTQPAPALVTFGS